MMHLVNSSEKSTLWSDTGVDQNFHGKESKNAQKGKENRKTKKSKDWRVRVHKRLRSKSSDLVIWFDRKSAIE